MNNIFHKELTDRILGCVFTVHNILGPGLLESAYEEAMGVELKLNNIPFERQNVYPLEYKGYDIGGYIADLVVDQKVILELKSVAAFNLAMEAQLINYLKISGIPVGYLINFQGTRVEWRRLVGKREDHSP